MSTMTDYGVLSIEEVKSTSKAALRSDSIVGRVTAEHWLLSGGMSSTRAFSCLVEPEVGDQVLVLAEESQTVILSILHRSPTKATKISTIGQGSIQLKTTEFAVFAHRGITFEALTSLKFSVPLGAIQSISATLMQTVKGSLVNIAHSMLSKAEHYELNVEESLITRAKMQSINAESELFMDAKRINMG